jgi:hypothetical protein
MAAKGMLAIYTIRVQIRLPALWTSTCWLRIHDSERLRSIAYSLQFPGMRQHALLFALTKGPSYVNVGETCMDRTAA